MSLALVFSIIFVILLVIAFLKRVKTLFIVTLVLGVLAVIFINIFAGGF